MFLVINGGSHMEKTRCFSRYMLSASVALAAFIYQPQNAQAADSAFQNSGKHTRITLHNVDQSIDGLAISALCRTHAGTYLPTTIDLYGVHVDSNGHLHQNISSDEESTFQQQCYSYDSATNRYVFNGVLEGNYLSATCYNTGRSSRTSTSIFLQNIQNVDGNLQYIEP
jgi:hypothetical protein